MKILFFLIALPTITLLFNASCKRGGYKLPYIVDHATVIGYEICHNDESKNYWLLNIFGNSGNYGDTLKYNGTVWPHVVKTTDLDSAYKRIGMRILCGFDISRDQIQSTGCTVSSPETYQLRVITLRRQSELR